MFGTSSRVMLHFIQDVSCHRHHPENNNSITLHITKETGAIAELSIFGLPDESIEFLKQTFGYVDRHHTIEDFELPSLHGASEVTISEIGTAPGTTLQIIGADRERFTIHLFNYYPNPERAA